MPTRKKIAWQLGKQWSLPVGCIVKSGSNCLSLFPELYGLVGRTCGARTTTCFCLGPSRPPRLVVLSFICVQNTQCDDSPASLGDHEIFEGRSTAKPITLLPALCQYVTQQGIKKLQSYLFEPNPSCHVSATDGLTTSTFWLKGKFEGTQLGHYYCNLLSIPCSLIHSTNIVCLLHARCVCILVGLQTQAELMSLS